MPLVRFLLALLPAPIRYFVRRQLLRIRLWYKGADSASSLEIRSFGRFQVAYRKRTSDETVLRHSFDHDEFFSGVPSYQPAETDVILDVGAHIGTFSLLAATKVSRGTVYAIEASEETFNYLRINAALNGLKNLAPFHLALSDRRGTSTLYHDTGNWGHSLVSKLSDSSETVECCTLQQFFDEHGIDACSFIKFNCEGAEFPILLNSPPSLLKRVGKMLVLFHGDLWKQNSPQDLLTHLGASGFECEVTNCEEERGWIVATNSAFAGA
jgi:FkbM family methyltransferase